MVKVKIKIALLFLSTLLFVLLCRSTHASDDDLTVKAMEGNADARYELGVMYYEGFADVLSYKEAIKWFQKAAEQGHPKAQYALGTMYEKGEGNKKPKTLFLNCLPNREAYPKFCVE